MNRVHPSEVEVEQMADELMTDGDLGPWNVCVWWSRAMATKAIILLALLFVKLNYIDQPVMSDGVLQPLYVLRIFMMEPLGDRLVCVTPTKSADDFPVVAITPDSR